MGRPGMASENRGIILLRLMRERRPLIVAALLLAMAAAPLLIIERAAKKDAGLSRARLHEMRNLEAEYRSIRARVDAIQKEKLPGRASGPARVMEEIFSGLGIKGKLKGIRDAGTREVPGGTEQNGEVRIENVDINELVNILYRVENPPVLLSLRRLTIKRGFENPDLLNATLTVSLISRK